MIVGFVKNIYVFITLFPAIEEGSGEERGREKSFFPV